MKTILFSNPSADLFFKLKAIGLIDFWEQSSATEVLKNKPLNLLKLDGISENACWGNSHDINEDKDAYIDKYYSCSSQSWKSATIDLSDKGIEMLTNSKIKGWEILK